ncbi:integral membrane protein GPR180-like [Tubulanus polymorphus]|uniref:integral membrane protein GPR180-like n=1 Tax=Tubulanus polymorphus TaxID=672921 RepID=UPI003DA2C093
MTRFAGFSALIIGAVIVGRVRAKTELGLINSAEAKRNTGQIIGDFLYYGEPGYVFYQLSSLKEESKPTFDLYLMEDWKSRYSEIESARSNCQQVLDKARVSFQVTALSGNHTVPYLNKPRRWVLVYTDKYTCSSSDTDKTTNNDHINTPDIQYRIQFMNPDSLDNPTEHFSGEEAGLISFYQLVVLACFVVACIFAPQLVQTLSKRGPMHLVLYLLTGATVCQALDAFFMLFHLYRYSSDGLGSAFLETLAELLDLIAQFLMLHMLLSMSLGWTLAGSHKSSRLDTLRTKPAAQIVSCLGILQAILFIWEQFQGIDHKLYHPPDTIAGLTLLTLRVLLAAVFAGNLLFTVSTERSALKRDFYTSFAKNCLLWFNSYPVLLLFSFLLSDYYSYKFLTIAVVFCQSVAVSLLYKLFLSRSLYWEVSALSSSLPIKLDKSFSIKIYS